MLRFIVNNFRKEKTQKFGNAIPMQHSIIYMQHATFHSCNNCHCLKDFIIVAAAAANENEFVYVAARFNTIKCEFLSRKIEMLFLFCNNWHPSISMNRTNRQTKTKYNEYFEVLLDLFKSIE